MNVNKFGRWAIAALAVLAVSAPLAARADTTLLNVSYDPTRELYAAYNLVFQRYWAAKTHQPVTIQQSHGGSGKQAQAVLNGLQADVVTLGVQSDIDALAKAGLVAPTWQKQFPHDSVPYWSTIVLLVRAGNPKRITDLSDLARPGIQVITPNPKTSSGGRWAYVALWGYALEKNHGNQAAARAFVSSVYKNVPVLDSGARGSTNTFTQRGLGDVLIAWENEADLITKKLNRGQYQIVYPSLSPRAEPPVAIVDRVVAVKNTRVVATAYLQYLYSPQGQAVAAANFYRPWNPVVAKQYAGQFPKIKLFKVETLLGGWDAVQKTHFASGGIFDQIETGR